MAPALFILPCVPALTSLSDGLLPGTVSWTKSFPPQALLVIVLITATEGKLGQKEIPGVGWSRPELTRHAKYAVEDRGREGRLHKPLGAQKTVTEAQMWLNHRWGTLGYRIWFICWMLVLLLFPCDYCGSSLLIWFWFNMSPSWETIFKENLSF